MKTELKVVTSDGIPAPDMLDDELTPEMRRKLRQPMLIGGGVIGLFVVGSLVWAAVTPITSAVTAAGVVRVEANRKTIRHSAGGIVKAIPVHEGQHVAAGQTLLVLDDVQARASVDVFQNQYDALSAQSALFAAESSGRQALNFPPDMLARASDPHIAGLMRDQQLLFASRLQLYNSQADVLNQRMSQVDSQIVGVKAQLDSIEQSVKLTQEEMAGYQTLYEKGYAPKTLILRYDRSLADLNGRRGALMSEITRLNQLKGETRLQLNTLRDQRISQAADGLRQMQGGLIEVTGRLTAARQTLEHTVLKSPVDGYVLDLSQFTVGGVLGAGEVVMNIVPADAPLIVLARLKPTDIDDVRVGMKAKVRLSAFNYRKVSPVDADVIGVSADQLSDPKTGAGYFRADLRIPASELTKLPKGAKITPGMPAQVMVRTGQRTILSYLVSPLTDSIGDAMKEN